MQITGGNHITTVKTQGSIGLWTAVSIGIGAMVGAGIFSILGVAGEITGNALWFSFVIAGIAALIIVYSYAKLAARYPSAGGPTEFLVKGFGDGILSGGFNFLLWISYVFGLSLYSRAFGGYAATFLPGNPSSIWVNVFATGIILVFTLVNFIGAKAVGRSELYIVVIKIAILIGFVAIGAFSIQPTLLAIQQWPPFRDILSGAAVVFLAYQGFSLITNAAEDMENPEKNVPRALYLSVLIVIVIYVSVAITVIGNLPIPQVVSARDFALAQAAQPFLGTIGFKIIAIAALLSTSSGINATLYGGANISYILAKEGQLPAFFDRKIWRTSREGLLVTAALTILFANLLDLEGIAVVGSASILLIYVAVNIAHLRLHRETSATPIMLWLATLVSVVFILLLIYYELQRTPVALLSLGAVLIFCFATEWAYRHRSKRTIRTRM